MPVSEKPSGKWFGGCVVSAYVMQNRMGLLLMFPAFVCLISPTCTPQRSPGEHSNESLETHFITYYRTRRVVVAMTASKLLFLFCHTFWARSGRQSANSAAPSYGSWAACGLGRASCMTADLSTGRPTPNPH